MKMFITIILILKIFSGIQVVKAQTDDLSSGANSDPNIRFENISNVTKPISNVADAIKKCDTLLNVNLEDLSSSCLWNVSWQDRSYYVGCLKDGLRSGMGCMTFASGATYNGEWKNDNMNGMGTLEDKSSRKCTGQWQDGYLDGIGECIYLQDRNKNHMYTGSFSEGYMYGEGNYTYPDGKVYVGKMRFDRMDGVGVLHWTEGYSYIGIWYVGQMIGSGKIILPDKSEIAGKFTPGDPLFSGSSCCNSYKVNCFLLYNDSSLYVGECQNDMPVGYGKLVYGTQRNHILDQKYSGHWKEGYRDGLGLQYFDNNKVFYGDFYEDKMEGIGLLLDFKDEACYNVTMKNGVELKLDKMPNSLEVCRFEVEGKRYVKKESFTDICQSSQESADKNGDSSTDDHLYDDEETVTVVEYNILHCQRLHTKYCNQVTRYEGKLFNGLKSGPGIQEFTNGSIFYGNFAFDYMHGSGAMILPDDIYSSGNMHLDSFDFGVVLYPNMTLIQNRKNRTLEKELKHEVQIRTGATKCFKYSKNKKPELSCLTGRFRIVDEFDYKYKRDERGNGFETKDIQRKFYRGQILDWEWHGLGYLWIKHNPTYIGMIKRERLNGYGLRILYSENNVTGLLLGFWKDGRINGPAISISETWTLIGNLKSPTLIKDLSPTENIIRYIKSNNNEYLRNIYLERPSFYDD